MASAPQAFTRRVKDRAAVERKVVEFTLRTTDEDEEGNEIVVREETYHASYPSDEQLMVAFAEAGREAATVADEIAAMFDLLKATLPTMEFRRMYRRFKDAEDLDFDFEALNDIFEWLMEQWQDFPTQSPAGSRSSRDTSGPKSTGRVRGKASTR